MALNRFKHEAYFIYDRYSTAIAEKSAGAQRVLGLDACCPIYPNAELGPAGSARSQKTRCRLSGWPAARGPFTWTTRYGTKNRWPTSAATYSRTTTCATCWPSGSRWRWPPIWSCPPPCRRSPRRGTWTSCSPRWACPCTGIPSPSGCQAVKRSGCLSPWSWSPIHQYCFWMSLPRESSGDYPVRVRRDVSSHGDIPKNGRGLTR